MNTNYIDPNLLIPSARDKKLSVFLCGPGVDSIAFKAREHIREILTDNFNCKVVLGEDLDKKTGRTSNRSDLQTLETAFAHQVDFTLLMLNSPGSIAELGTFSMIPNIMHRLYVIVPSRFFDAKSYIARGPLSLMASTSDNNISYIEEGNNAALAAALNFPVMLYKYVKAKDGRDYAESVTRHFRTQGFERDDYQTYFRSQKEDFLQSLVASAIYLHGNPTFSDLLNFLHLEPRSLSEALSRLFQLNGISRASGNRYILNEGLHSMELTYFDKKKLSKRRSHQLAFS